MENNTWVKVDNKLPVNEGQVLLCFGEPCFGSICQTIETGYYDGESNIFRFWTFDREIKGYGVTHWMKLPKLPSKKGGSNGD